MTTTMKRQLLTAALALMAVAVCAQENELSIDAQLRTRGEHDNGAILPHEEGEQASNFITERTRLSFDFNRQNLELKASLQHTGLWGGDNVRQTENHTILNEAWAKLKLGDAFFAQLGRMQLAYDDERILGAHDWSLDGVWHDALRVGYEDGVHRLHVIAAMNQNLSNRSGDFYDGPMPYKNMMALWYHFQGESIPLGVSLLALNTGYERGTEGHGRTNYLQTFGTDITFRPLSWNVHGAFYYQMGKTALRQVQAWMASGSIGFDFAPELGINAGYDYMTGNDYNNNKWNAFDALYGTYHNFFGAMDYFGNSLSWGLQDIKGGITSQICDKVRLEANYHYLMTAKQIDDFAMTLGQEIDVKLSAELMKDVTLGIGYSTMVGTKTMDRIKGGSHDSWQDWAWLQLNINPRVLFTKW